MEMTSNKEVLRRIEYTGDMLLNMGPQHPSTHGVINFLVQTDGEVMKRAIPEVGYLHRSLEKWGRPGAVTVVARVLADATPLRRLGEGWRGRHEQRSGAARAWVATQGSEQRAAVTFALIARASAGRGGSAPSRIGCRCWLCSARWDSS